MFCFRVCVCFTIQSNPLRRSNFVGDRPPGPSIIHTALAATLLWGRVFKAVFLGPLRDVEVEILYDNARYAITETCLALTIFREELTTRVLTLFTALLFSKSFHWLCQSRVEYVESDTVSRWTHARLVTLMLLLLVVDVGFVAMCVYLWNGPSVLILFGFEYTILAVSVLATLVRYVLHMVDMSIEGNWPQKGSYIFFLEFATEVVRFLAYVAFFSIIFTFYGMPLHIVRDVWMSYVNLKRRLIVFNKYRKLTANMQERFPNATEEELAACEHTCIICRDQMDEGKKLPCSHIFHLDCLRLWLQQQQSCPTCRADIPTADQAASAAAATSPPQPQQPPAQQPPQPAQPQQQQQQQQPHPPAHAPMQPQPQQQPAAAARTPFPAVPVAGFHRLPPMPAQQHQHAGVPPDFPQPPVVPYQADAPAAVMPGAAMPPPPFVPPPGMGMPDMGMPGMGMPGMGMGMPMMPYGMMQPPPWVRPVFPLGFDAGMGPHDSFSERPFSLYRVVTTGPGAAVRAGPEPGSALLRTIPPHTAVLIRERRPAASGGSVYAVMGGGFILEAAERVLEPLPTPPNPMSAAPWGMGPWGMMAGAFGGMPHPSSSAGHGSSSSSSSSASSRGDSPISRALVGALLDMEEARTELAATAEALQLLLQKNETDGRRVREALARLEDARAGLERRARAAAQGRAQEQGQEEAKVGSGGAGTGSGGGL